MPYSTRWEARGVVWKFEGRVTGMELLAANHAIYGDPRFDQMAYQIVDLTEVERFDVTEEDMIVIAANDRAAALSRADVKVAIATRNEIVRQLSALYDAASATSPWEQQVFETVADARAWVNEVTSHRRKDGGG